MKKMKILVPALLSLVLSSCTSVRVASDYDKAVDFTAYKTYAFFKTGIDKVEISDLDKKRILRSVDETMAMKGFTKSDTPDMLINFFTKARQDVNVNQFNNGWGWGGGFGYGWGYGWGWGGNNASVTRTTEGTLFIDLIDAKKKEMIWQGEGVGILTENSGDKDARIKEFVMKILEQYPPMMKTK